MHSLPRIVSRHSVSMMSMDTPAASSASSLLVNAVSAWSVSGETLTSTDLAASFFAASLFPYLALLFFLSRPETKTPKGANFGFQFLLAFVFATIPAGIYAKVHYHDILANIDWLHGSAESLLTLTNLFIIFGFRATRAMPAEDKTQAPSNMSKLQTTAGITATSLLAAAAAGFFSLHSEPANALSIPTWMVHTSSLLEWLVAMKLIYEVGSSYSYYSHHNVHRVSYWYCVAFPDFGQPALEGTHLGNDSLTHLGPVRMHVPPVLQRSRS